MVTLQSLLIHARVNRYHSLSWFKDALWKPPTLFIVGEDEAAFVERNWAPAMRELVPDLQVKVKPVTPVQKPKVVGNPLWKASRGPRQEGLL